MSSATSYSNFDEPFARLFIEYEGLGYNEFALPALEKLLSNIPERLCIPKGANILDLCCGTGWLSQWLLNEGYQVTGVDRSERMLQYAREKVPDCKLILGDARFFDLPPTFHAVFSIGLGFNHIRDIEELINTFHNVYRALQINSVFIFDLRLDDQYNSQNWNGTMSGDIQDDYAWAKKRFYHPENQEGRMYITVFKLIEKAWERIDTTWIVRGYSKAEVQDALEKVGFTEVSVYSLGLDLAVPGQAGTVFFVCRKLG